MPGRAKTKRRGEPGLAAGALLVLALLAGAGSLPSSAQSSPLASGLPGIEGRWASAGFGSIVELRACACADRAAAVCGRIRWLWDALDPAGHPRLDSENPVARARSLPLVGAEILRCFQETSPGIWTGGSVYNPEDGRTYRGSIRLRRDGTLELEGCALRIFCQRQVWRRPADLLEQAGIETRR